jgi:ribosomal RNA-processing protein 17
MREQRKADLQSHLKQFNQELRKQNPDIPSESEEDDDDAEEATFEGFGAVDEIDGQEDEYVDEDKYTTVTVEAMGGSDDEEDKKPYVPKPEDPTAFAKPKKRPMTKDGKLKQKKRNFRYETKTERKATREKQKKRNHKEATARREATEAKEKTAKSRKGKK